MHIATVPVSWRIPIASIDQGGPAVFVILDHSGPSLFEGGAFVRALSLLVVVLLALVLLAAL